MKHLRPSSGIQVEIQNLENLLIAEITPGIRLGKKRSQLLKAFWESRRFAEFQN